MHKRTAGVSKLLGNPWTGRGQQLSSHVSVARVMARARTAQEGQQSGEENWHTTCWIRVPGRK